MQQGIVLPVDGMTRVAEVRRSAMAIAETESLSGNVVSNVGIVATELATNLLKHATAGEIHLASLGDRGRPGVEILSVDRGPGVFDLEQCLVDGYSTAGTPGTGLGAIRRLSNEFDAYSEHDRGTVVVSRLYARPGEAVNLLPVVVGFAARPISGEEVSGDAWAVSFTDDGCLLFLADGLGHGKGAAQASGEAVSAFRNSRDSSIVTILQHVHAALRGTRGAAVAIATLSYTEACVRFAGIGNISGRVLGTGKTGQMMSHVGTAGYEARKFQEFTYPLPRGSAVILHSDGITSSWSLAEHPGLEDRDPSLIAAVLYRDSARGRDDICAVVVKARA